jgi:hypothetical protein
VNRNLFPSGDQANAHEELVKLTSLWASLPLRLQT